jgi:hypothetical protein
MGAVINMILVPGKICGTALKMKGHILVKKTLLLHFLGYLTILLLF